MGLVSRRSLLLGTGAALTLAAHRPGHKNHPSPSPSPSPSPTVQLAGYRTGYTLGYQGA